jgi:hypothetical protein
MQRCSSGEVRLTLYADFRYAAAEGHEEHALPGFGRMLELAVERVLISHGWSIEHTRAELEAALDRRPGGAE